METVTQKRFSTEDISKIKFVQNISGAVLRLPDLSEDGKEGHGITLDVDEVLELVSVVSDKAKIKSRDLRKGLEGSIASRSFDAVKPVLQAVTGPDDPKTIRTAIAGTMIPAQGSHQAPPGHFQIKLMEQQLADLEYDLKSTKAPGIAEVLKMTVENLKKRIEEAKKTVPTGLGANVVILKKEEIDKVL